MNEREAMKVKGFLGLCYRAGQVILGQDACVGAVRRNAAALILLDESSTGVSVKRFRNACRSHRVPLYGMPEGLIALALGKDGRKAAAVRPGTMAQKLTELVLSEIIADDPSENHSNDESAYIAGVQA